MNQDISPLELRHKIRSGEFTSNTSGYSPGFVQGNLCILPADYANEFLQFCQANPRPCPLIGMASTPGDYHIPKLGDDLDIRSDIPSYRVFENGELVDEVNDISRSVARRPGFFRARLLVFLRGSTDRRRARSAQRQRRRQRAHVSHQHRLRQRRAFLRQDGGQHAPDETAATRFARSRSAPAFRRCTAHRSTSAIPQRSAYEISITPNSAMRSPSMTAKCRCSGPAV